MAVSRKEVVMTVRFTENEAAALRRAADKAGQSVSALVREATLQYVKPASRASVSSSTGAWFSGEPRGAEGQPVGGNLEVLSG